MINPNDSSRPDPDALLEKINAEEKKAARGKLKIFFGSSAGVGKTYAMLSAAREKLQEGADVAIGLIETHKRPETEKLLEGIPVLAPKKIAYRGVSLRELDLDAALERKPAILLVDELAHTNPTPMRHPKRWNDVMELLDAGIDVYTTLNVQHIESLADVVAGTTGVWVKETVPDSIFDAADDIVLVDIDADDLLKRLSEGKVYVAPQVKARAAENFFRKSNLIALRELALRRTAERVDAQMDAYNEDEGLQGRLPVADKILVCIGPDPLSARLVRSTKRLANALKAPWTAIYVENERHNRLSDLGRRKIEALFRMVERIGGKTVIVQADKAEDAIIRHARENKYTKIIVGKPIRPFWNALFRGSLADKMIRKSGDVDVYVITGAASGLQDTGVRRPVRDELGDYLWSLITVFLCTLPGVVLRPWITLTDQALIYLSGIVIIAAKVGRTPSLFYVMLSAVAFNFFFLSPINQLGIEDHSFLLTFVIMLVTGYIIAAQASKLRSQLILARERERQTQTLYRLTRELASTRGRQKVSEVMARHVSEMLNVEVTIWLPELDNNLASIVGTLPDNDYVKERSVLQWCFDNVKPAGLGTETMPSSAGLYLPLEGTSGALGVLGVIPRQEKRVFTMEETTALETLTSLLASALERVFAGEEILQKRLAEESEKLRQTLLKR